jgi:isoleucyl-tRNA synthetase
VHLAPFTRPGLHPPDGSLESAMGAVRRLATLGRSARESAGIKVRQPLERMVCVAPGATEESLLPLMPLLATELNVKRVEFVSSGDELVRLEAKPNFRTLGKKFGKATPQAAERIAALGEGELRRLAGGESLELSVCDISRTVGPEDVMIRRIAGTDLVVQEEGGYFAALDPEVSPELRLEGLARELISRVQRLRKEAGLAVSDRIRLEVTGDAAVRDVLQAHGRRIASEVLATELVQVDELAGGHHATQTLDLEGIAAQVALTRVS